MKKIVLTIIFIVGLGIFLYPIVSDMVSTTAHQTIIKESRKTISEMNESEIKHEKEKVMKHNEDLAASDLNFVDPFAEDEKNHSAGNSSYYDALGLGDTIGTVHIPKIDVELPIYHGTSESVLSQGAGHLENSSLPTSDLGTHSVITAHRGLPSATLFRDLDELKIGDQFFVEVLDEIIAYEVEEIDIVLPTETSWLNMEGKQNKVTLLTCDPYMINTHRMIVTGSKVPYKEDIAKNSSKKDQPLSYIVGLIFVLLLAASILFFIMRNNKKRGDQ